MQKYHNTNIVLIYGMPTNGKTTLAKELMQNCSNSQVIHFDILFIDSVDKEIPEPDLIIPLYVKNNSDVYLTCVSNEFKDDPRYKQLIFSKIIREIEIRFKNNFVSNLIIEGFAVRYFINDIIHYLKQKNITRIFQFELNHFKIHYNNEEILNDEFRIDNVKKILYEYPRELFSKSNYQTLDFLGDFSKKDSNSIAKYELSKLKDFDLAGSKILDVGCNAGYFLMKLLMDKNPKELVGIDTNPSYLSICYGFNRIKFDTQQIKLYAGNVFDFQEKDFDLIYCFSTFHYFADKQYQFINLMHQLLNDNGVFILEVEESPTNQNVPFIEKRSRGGNLYENYLDYPNQLMIQTMINQKFNIVDRYQSVIQPGQFYDRYFYHLVKK